MNFAFNADQDLLRDSAVRLLRDRVQLGKITDQGNRPDTTYDPALWREMVSMGWSSLLVPEQYGGLGLSLVDWVVITEEIGRTLAPCPYLGNYAGTLALLAAGSEEQKQTLLPAVVSGTAQLALAWNEQEKGADHHMVAVRFDGATLSGKKRYVLDADTATHFVVSARNKNSEITFYLVPRNQAGVHIDVLPWMDVTRRVCNVHFDSALAETMPTPFATAWPSIKDGVLFALASENAGGADEILRKTVSYANERKQFGRPIASFQAIKHKCADMMMKVESAKALTYYAAWALEANVLGEGSNTKTNDGPLAVAMASSYAADAYKVCTAEAIQVHGAIGFTWHMPIHLYYKRARANAVMFGTSAQQRERVIQLVTKAPHRVAAEHSGRLK